MTNTYHISGNELNDAFLMKLKQKFGEKRLLITVAEEKDEIDYLLSTNQNKNKFEQSLHELKEGEMVTATMEELRK